MPWHAELIIISGLPLIVGGGWKVGFVSYWRAWYGAPGRLAFIVCRFSGQCLQRFIQRDLVPPRAGSGGSAVGAQVPRRFHQLAAVVTDFAQSRVAARADDPVGLNAPVAARAKRDVLDILQQCFLFQAALVFIFQSARGAQDEIDQYAGQEQNRYDQCSQDAYQRITRTAADVLEGPDDHSKPESCEEGGGETDRDHHYIAKRH